MELFPCLYKTIFAFDCPICGFQRSLILLFKGNLLESFKMFPPLIPSVLLIILFVLHLFNKKVVDKKHLFLYSSIVLTFITINYIIKLTI